MQTFTQGLSVFAVKIDKPMRDMILVQKIIKLLAISRTGMRENT
jgi:hypothetical protein